MCIITFSILYNLIKFWEFTTVFSECRDVFSEADCATIWAESPNSSFPVATVEYTSLRTHRVYSTINLVTNTAVVGVVPILLLSFLNSRIIRTMKRNTEMHNKLCSGERRDQAMTALLTGVVMVMVVCHSPKAVMNMYESYHRLLYGDLEHEPLWGKLVIKVSHLLLGLSSAGNIVIYSYKVRILQSRLLSSCHPDPDLLQDFKFRSILVKECSLLRSCSQEPSSPPMGESELLGNETLF